MPSPADDNGWDLCVLLCVLEYVNCASKKSCTSGRCSSLRANLKFKIYGNVILDSTANFQRKIVFSSNLTTLMLIDFLMVKKWSVFSAILFALHF